MIIGTLAVLLVLTNPARAQLDPTTNEAAVAQAVEARVDVVHLDREKLKESRNDPTPFHYVTRGSRSIEDAPPVVQQEGEGGGSDADLALKLSNPVADLISVPFQSNFDFGGGPDGNGFRYTLNLQPVIPISISKDWNLISRTIVPFIHQENMIGSSSQDGLGDTTQSLFFSPKKPCHGIIWGVGPALLLPTATDDLLGTEKFGVGPTAVALTQTHGWTLGVLANHIWSVAGSKDRPDVDSTFLQPFITYTTKTHTTFGINTESTYDWEADQWTVPMNAFVSQLVRIGKQPVQFQLGGRWFVEAPDEAPEWGIRFAVTLLFPK